MRTLVIAAALSILAGPALAEPIDIEPVTFSPDYMHKLEDDYGLRETEDLNEIVQIALTRALTRAGATVEDGATLRIETTINDAKPNRPTFQQLSDEPGLDFGRSFGVGGADLHGVLRGADGAVIAEVDSRWYETDISWAAASSQWSDARRAARRYADAVAQAVVAHR